MSEFRKELDRLLAKGPLTPSNRFVWPPRPPQQSPPVATSSRELPSVSSTTPVTSPNRTKVSLSNLIGNPSGENGYDGWIITKEGGDGWNIEDEPKSCAPVPTNKFLGVKPKNLKETCCFVTSYEWCAKSYLVDLTDELVWLKHEGTPFEIKCGQMYMTRRDCGGEFLWRLTLLDSSKRILKEYEAEYELSPQSETSKWKRAEHTFTFGVKDKKLAGKIRFLEFWHQGRDDKGQNGHYGMKFARSTVVVVDLEKARKEKEDQKKKEGDKKKGGDVEDMTCFRCPVCLEVPKGRKVFQCKNGHMICEECIEHVQSCPQCRVPMRKEESVRNLALEAVLEQMKI